MMWRTMQGSMFYNGLRIDSGGRFHFVSFRLATKTGGSEAARLLFKLSQCDRLFS